MTEDAHERLARAVARQMTGAAAASIEVVTAMAALLARVAYADGRYTRTEVERVREELSQVLGLDERGVDALVAVVDSDIEPLSQVELDRCTDVLRERLDLRMRSDVVKVLLELAAADRELADAEVAVIREIAAKLMVDEALLQAMIQLARKQGARKGS